MPNAPIVTEMRVIPVAGHDSMLLNLSGAHGPFFTRNLVILTDSSGNTGVGEVPGGAAIARTLEDARGLVEGRSVGDYHAVLNDIRRTFGEPERLPTKSPVRRKRSLKIHPQDPLLWLARRDRIVTCRCFPPTLGRGTLGRTKQ